MALPSADQAKAWNGRMIVDRVGATIGDCVQIYADDATGAPEWIRARMGSTEVVLPLVDAVEEGDRVRTAVERDIVLLAPTVADEDHITPDEEADLYRHYGIAYSREHSETLLPAGESPAPAAGIPAPVEQTPPTDAGLLVDEALLVAEDLQPAPVSRRRLVLAAATAAVTAAAAVVVVVLTARRRPARGARRS